jgi:hypothetical protein
MGQQVIDFPEHVMFFVFLQNHLFPEDYNILSCNTVYFGESLAFQWNLTHPSSGSKRKPSKKPAEAGSRLSQMCREELGSKRQWDDKGG